MMGSINSSSDSLSSDETTVIEMKDYLNPSVDEGETLPKDFCVHSGKDILQKATRHTFSDFNPSLLPFDDNQVCTSTIDNYSIDTELETFIDPFSNFNHLPAPVCSLPEMYLSRSNETSTPVHCNESFEMTEDRVLQLLSSIPDMCQRLSDLEASNSLLVTRCSTLESMNYTLEKSNCELNAKCNTLETRLIKYCQETDKRINEGNQYTRRNCLLVKKLNKVPRNIHGWKFSKYVARELNKLFPSIPVSYSDIDASHILYLDEDKKPVVVVKFVNRDLRNLIWGNRDYINCRTVLLSEHLTPINRELFNKAQAVGNAWSEQCKIFATANGQKKLIEQESDLDGIDPLTEASVGSRPHQSQVNGDENKQKNENRNLRYSRPPLRKKAGQSRFNHKYSHHTSSHNSKHFVHSSYYQRSKPSESRSLYQNQVQSSNYVPPPSSNSAVHNLANQNGTNTVTWGQKPSSGHHTSNFHNSNYHIGTGQLLNDRNFAFPNNRAATSSCPNPPFNFPYQNNNLHWNH